ncbi:aldose 1-epimerase [Burkholderia orbicola]|uniref:aldose 1-epimerase n=1 Tax=Burkholderia cepacia complex TaxID=87882 RepID=UPI0004831483|nr:MULTISPECIES: aldose 1-epimerase [Burkholderia cepacia complex]KOR19494.1 aldose epimerase [Burkholderia cenocepacia]MBR7981540.1 aldose 1-epimerase [Burkholderia cenocepacia]MBR7995881.1 aldose 1-epimerase [Burkholderia cenocepacia]MDN7994567.1 aldose 1-epimerase [Burkholderia orbicola]
MTATSSRASSSTSQSRRARLAAAAQPVSPGPQTAVFAQGVGAAHAAAVTLSNASLRLDVLPHLGGGIARFDWRGENGALVPVFRRCEHPETATDPNELACYPLLPYSNRIGDGRFECDGRKVAVPRNRRDEPLPIHGDGWLARWQVDDATDTSLQLSLDRTAGAPYAFRAIQSFELDDATLSIALTIENAGRTRLPFGLGVHPFLVRDAVTELAAAAGGLWLSGADFLPVRHVSVPPAWQFGVAYPLPATLVNHAFTGWGGHATVSWPRRRLSLTVAADADAYVLYTPPGEDFFCFEPVDHPINAVNLPGGAAAHGMTLLAPGERLTRRFAFTVERADARSNATTREGARRRG